MHIHTYIHTYTCMHSCSYDVKRCVCQCEACHVTAVLFPRGSTALWLPRNLSVSCAPGSPGTIIQTIIGGLAIISSLLMSTNFF